MTASPVHRPSPESLESSQGRATHPSRVSCGSTLHGKRQQAQAGSGVAPNPDEVVSTKNSKQTNARLPQVGIGSRVNTAQIVICEAQPVRSGSPVRRGDVRTALLTRGIRPAGVAPAGLMEERMESGSEITADTVRALFTYDPRTGHLLHQRARGIAKRGDRAGTLKPTGYRLIRVNGRWFQSARVVWLHYYGVWPKQQVDHINHVRDDDRIENLRDVAQRENLHNLSGKRKNNTSGTVGVTWNSRSQKWYAVIYVMSKAIFLGSHDTYEAAVEARQAGKRIYHQPP